VDSYLELMGQLCLQAEPVANAAKLLDALECGGIGFGRRLGYGEHAMRGPWPSRSCSGTWLATA